MAQTHSFDVTAHQEKTGFNWGTATVVTILHIGAIAAFFMFSWQALLVTLFLWYVSGSLGIGMGFHRLLTHRGYKTPKPIEYFLTTCGLLALEGGSINWVATHRIHHAHTDQDGDPHTPRDGKWWSHIGWILMGTGQQYPVEIQQRYVPDLMKDPVHRFLNRFYYVPNVLVGIALYMWGGWSFVMWGIALRITFGMHATWLVNSATHLWGSRRFETTDDSRNNFIVALVTFGEGWHNNHHAHPRASRHGVEWYEIDVNWYGIRFLEMLGLAWDIKKIKMPTPGQPDIGISPVAEISNQTRTLENAA